MTDNTELKRLAEIMARDVDGDLSDAEVRNFHQHLSGYEAATTPEKILALIAENERIAKTSDAWERLSVYSKSISDSFRAERDQLKAENERQAAQYKEWQASHHANYCKVAEERDQLRAEVAGLKTGYEAYERVNAELKAELAAEIQRRFDGNEIAARERDEEVRKLKAENEALRKDAERYRWLRDSGQYDWDVSYGKLELRIATPHDDSSDLDACIDAALGQGEQP